MKTILMLVSAAALATAAEAEPTVVVDGDTRSMVRVSYADLNLGSTIGRERLQYRVAAAVRAICQDNNPDPLAMKLAEQRCYAESIREAGVQIDQALKARSAGLAGGRRAIGVIRR